jgi:tetratricopeptide (TPR) repeat protein
MATLEMTVAIRQRDNPYPGLRSFEPDEAEIFFGRDEQTQELVSRLSKTRFLAVVGTSGSGKSSLVRAGLIPWLLAGFMAVPSPWWRVAVMLPGNNPIRRLADALSSQTVLGPAGSHAESSAAELMAMLNRGSLGLVEVVQTSDLDPATNLLVVVDQFEELFRFIEEAPGHAARDEAQAFVQLLLEAANQRERPIFVALTMRSEYLGHAAPLAGLPQAINTGLYLIPQMSRQQLREAISGPAALCGGSISDRLIDTLLNDIQHDRDQLPVLQHALMRMWSRHDSASGGSKVLDLPDYHGVGRLDEALSIHASEIYGELDESQRRIAERLFRTLTDTDADNHKVRRRATLKQIREVCDAPARDVTAVIDRFRSEGRSLLISSTGTDLADDTVIDISHESLIRKWDMLAEWVTAEAEDGRELRDLADAAARWRDDPEDTLGKVRLERADRIFARNTPIDAWVRRYRVDEEPVRLLMAASRRHLRMRERRKWLAHVSAYAAILVVITAAVGGGIWAYRTYTTSGQLWQARTRAETIIARNEDTIDGLSKWAVSLAVTGDLPGAKDALRRLGSDYRAQSSIEQVAVDLGNLGHVEDAVEIIKQVLDPSTQVIAFFRLVVRDDLRPAARDRFKVHFQYFLELTNELAAGWLPKAAVDQIFQLATTAALTLDLYDEALNLIDRVSLTESKPTLWRQAFLAMIEGGKARDALERAKARRDDSRIGFAVGSALAEAGQIEYLEDLESVIDLDPHPRPTSPAVAELHRQIALAHARQSNMAAVEIELRKSADGLLQSVDLSWVARRLIIEDRLTEALAVARLIPDGSLRARMLLSTIVDIAGASEAIELLQDLAETPSPIQDRAREALAVAFARKGRLDEARALVQRMTDESGRGVALQAIAAQLAVEGEWLESETVAGTITDGSYRDEAYRSIGWTMIDAGLIDDALRIAGSISEPSRRVAIERAVAVNFVAHADLQRVIEFVGNLDPEPGARDEVWAGVIEELARQGRIREALRQASRFVDDETHDSAFFFAVNAATAIDQSAGMVEMAKQIKNGDLRDQAFLDIVTKLASDRRFRVALDVAPNISNTVMEIIAYACIRAGETGSPEVMRTICASPSARSVEVGGDY